MSRQVVFFDIDGTLLRTGGAGMVAIDLTFQQLFGIENKTRVPVAGRTDFGILGDLFDANQLCFETHYEAFRQKYHENLRESLPKTNGFVLSGAHDLLNELKPFHSLGIITGNSKSAARSKLCHFQLEEFFSFGGYGDWDRDRNQVAKKAMDDAKLTLEQLPTPSSCWVIGDTPDDVTCAKSIGAKAVAVLTGRYDESAFVNTPADYVIPDLTCFQTDWLAS